MEAAWQDGIRYRVEIRGHARVLASDEQLLPQGSALDWQVWQPPPTRSRNFRPRTISEQSTASALETRPLNCCNALTILLQ